MLSCTTRIFATHRLVLVVIIFTHTIFSCRQRPADSDTAIDWGSAVIQARPELRAQLKNVIEVFTNTTRCSASVIGSKYVIIPKANPLSKGKCIKNKLC